MPLNVRWTRRWLWAAGIYNLCWGAAVVLAPQALFDLLEIQRMRYPQIWQCVGMVVGVYGIGYLIAAGDSRTHWPIVLVGLLGKVFGPLGFVVAVMSADFPPAFGWTIVANDVIWWVPFTMILWDAAWSRNDRSAQPVSDLADVLDRVKDLEGRSLREVTDERPTLVVLLRHSGCTFCRETLAELVRRADGIRIRGFGLAVVTMSSTLGVEELAARYRVQASWFSDPDCLTYRALELRRGTLRQLLGVRVFLRGALALLRGHGIGRLEGDGFQMPGAFLIHRGLVVRAFRHKLASDRPDYDKLTCELSP